VNGEPPILEFKKGFDIGHIVDTRSGEIEVTEIQDEAFIIAKELDRKPIGIETLHDATGIAIDEIKNICNDFKEMGFIVNPDDRYIWLPVPELV